MVNLRGVLSLSDVGGVAVLVASLLDRVSGNVRCADRTLDVIQVVATTIGRDVVKVGVSLQLASIKTLEKHEPNLVRGLDHTC